MLVVCLVRLLLKTLPMLPRRSPYFRRRLLLINKSASSRASLVQRAKVDYRSKRRAVVQTHLHIDHEAPLQILAMPTVCFLVPKLRIPSLTQPDLGEARRLQNTQRKKNHQTLKWVKATKKRTRKTTGGIASATNEAMERWWRVRMSSVSTNGSIYNVWV